MGYLPSAQPVLSLPHHLNNSSSPPTPHLLPLLISSHSSALQSSSPPTPHLLPLPISSHSPSPPTPHSPSPPTPHLLLLLISPHSSSPPTPHLLPLLISPSLISSHSSSLHPSSPQWAQPLLSLLIQSLLSFHFLSPIQFTACRQTESQSSEERAAGSNKA